MIKVETVGMIENSHVEPTLTSNAAVKQYSFMTVGGVTYLIANTLNGDDAYVDDYTFAAGEYLNGWDLGKWVGQILLIDGKHISGGITTQTTVGSTVTIDSAYLGTGGVGDYTLTVTGIINLTEKAVKVRIGVAESDVAGE